MHWVEKGETLRNPGRCNEIAQHIAKVTATTLSARPPIVRMVDIKSEKTFNEAALQKNTEIGPNCTGYKRFTLRRPPGQPQ